MRPQRHLVLHGFAEEALRRIPDGSVHCIVTSPPYWGLRRYLKHVPIKGGDQNCQHQFVPQPAAGFRSERVRDAKRQHLPDRSQLVSYLCQRCGAVASELGMEYQLGDYLTQMLIIFHECRRVLHPRGTLWLNMGDTYVNRNYDGDGSNPLMNPTLQPGALVGAPWRMALLLQETGWVLRSDVVWYKPNPIPSAPQRRPITSHEYVFMFVKSRDYYFDFGSAKRLSKEGFGGQLRDVWEINSGSGLSGSGLSHPVPFPEELPKRCILLSTPEWVCERCFGWGEQECGCDGAKQGAVVLDPFAGSGTVAVVAHRLGRSSVSIEAEIDYAELTLKRLQMEMSQSGLFDDSKAEVQFDACNLPKYLV